MWKATAPILLGLALTACIALPPGGGGDGGGGGGAAPPQPAPLPSSLTTADNDGIAVTGTPGNGSGQVRLCLTTGAGMWRKDLRISDGTTLISENGTTDCANVEPAFLGFQMAKAKAFGVITPVGQGNLDLTGWGGGIVTVRWNVD